LNYLGELPDMDQGRIQIDCWAMDKQGSVDLAKAVRDAIEPSAFMIGTPISSFEPDTKLFRYILEFDFFTSRPGFISG